VADIKEITMRAAHRLVATLLEEQQMLNQHLIELLANYGIKAESPDDANNSLVVFEEGSRIVTALSLARWVYLEPRKVEGGLYCTGSSVHLKQKGQTIRLLTTSPGRSTLWTI